MNYKDILVAFGDKDEIEPDVPVSGSKAFFNGWSFWWGLGCLPVAAFVIPSLRRFAV